MGAYWFSMFGQTEPIKALGDSLGHSDFPIRSLHAFQGTFSSPPHVAMHALASLGQLMRSYFPWACHFAIAAPQHRKAFTL